MRQQRCMRGLVVVGIDRDVAKRKTSDYLLFIGMDPALKADYFGVAIHALAREKPFEGEWMPQLIKVLKMQAPDWPAMWRELNYGVLKDYNSFYMLHIDYSNEKAVSDHLEQKYGESRVKKTIFTKGEAGTKMQLAQSARIFLASGYQFPKHWVLSDPWARENVRLLKEQINNEEITLNPDNSIKFKHKGPHNDLLHAWMLSLDVCREYMLYMQGRGGPTFVGSVGNSHTNDVMVADPFEKAIDDAFASRMIH